MPLGAAEAAPATESVAAATAALASKRNFLLIRGAPFSLGFSRKPDRLSALDKKRAVICAVPVPRRFQSAGPLAEIRRNQGISGYWGNTVGDAFSGPALRKGSLADKRSALQEALGRSALKKMPSTTVRRNFARSTA